MAVKAASFTTHATLVGRQGRMCEVDPACNLVSINLMINNAINDSYWFIASYVCLALG